VAAVTELPGWLHWLTLGVISTVQALRVGEVVTILAYLVVHLALMGAWSMTDDWGVALGKGAMTNVMMMMVPVTKTGALVCLLHLPFDRAVKLHRFLGRYAAVTMVAHLLTVRDRFPVWSFEATNGGVVVGAGTLAFILYCLVFATALPKWFRVSGGRGVEVIGGGDHHLDH
jgi:hypothetical protein